MNADRFDSDDPLPDTPRQEGAGAEHAPDPPTVAAAPISEHAPPEPAEPVVRRRSDSLAAGIAVLVMVSLLGCAVVVLIAAGNG